MLEFDISDGGKPGLRAGHDGALRLVAGGAELRQAILHLLSTRPGERHLRPDFGCPLDRLLFEPIDETTAGMAIRLVADALARHEPRARIDRLDAQRDPARPGQLRITLEFTDMRTSEAGQAVLAVPVGGAR